MGVQGTLYECDWCGKQFISKKCPSYLKLIDDDFYRGLEVPDSGISKDRIEACLCPHCDKELHKRLYRMSKEAHALRMKNSLK